jgi:hypothetical protein
MNYNTSTSLYETTIPGQPAETWVKFKIVAYNNAGNNTTRDGTEPYYTYQAIHEFPSVRILLILSIIATLLIIIIIYKRKSYPRIHK